MAFNSKEYYEEQLQRKVLYVPNLSLFLSKLHDQILKLPHEAFDGKMSEPVGVTYADIVQSFCNGVDVLYVILNPVRCAAGPEYAPCPVEKCHNLDDALKKLDWCYGVMDDMDVLNDHMVNMDLAPSEEYNSNEVLKDDDSQPEMPPSVPAADGKTVGEMEKKDERPVVEEDLAKTISAEPEHYRDIVRSSGFR